MCEQWVNGPKTIESTEPKFGAMLEKCSEEMRTRVSHNLLVNSNPMSIGNILQCQNFSSLERLLTVTANVSKFVELLRSKLKKPPNAVPTDVTLRDIDKAHTIWMGEMQTLFLVDSKLNCKHNDLTPTVTRMEY